MEPRRRRARPKEWRGARRACASTVSRPGNSGAPHATAPHTTVADAATAGYEDDPVVRLTGGGGADSGYRCGGQRHPYHTPSAPPPPSPPGYRQLASDHSLS